MDILINGNKYCKIESIQTLKQILFELIDIKYSPLEALKSNMTSFFDLVEWFCKAKRENKKGAERSKLTREITKVNNQREFWGEVENKDNFVKAYYNYALATDGFGPLRGFGFSNFFRDKGKGNSETVRISYKHAD